MPSTSPKVTASRVATGSIETVALYDHLSRNGATLTPTEYLALLNYRTDVDFRPLDPENRPAPFKRYRAVERVELPREFAFDAADAITALVADGGASVDEFAHTRLDLAGVARLLHLGAGVTRSTIGPLQHRTYFRAAMSAGNLHPLEVYVVCGPMDGLDAGVYHFAPLEFRLDRLRSTDERAYLARACATGDDRPPGASLVITGIPWRTVWKYAERGWRHLYWDAGALVANVMAAADGVGVHTRVLTGFVDREVASLVGIEGVEEFPLAVVELRGDEPISTAPDLPDPAPITLSAEPLSSDPLVLPLVVEAQRAGTLESPHEVRRWRTAARGGRPRPQAAEAVSPSGMSIDEAILRRGSTRLMRIAEAPKRLADVGMAVASRQVVGDFGDRGRAILRHYVNVHSVADTTPGTYLWTGRRLRLLSAGNHRKRSRELCLDQPLAGDSAFTVFHTTRLDELLRTYDARGYRVANFCAGLASGRLALAAFALSFGASALTFRDDAVSACFEPHASCLLVTAVGVPEYRNRPGGPPGAITELPHYEQLMKRFMARLGE